MLKPAQTNVKSLIIASHEFFPKANKDASVVAVGTAAAIVPPSLTPNIGGYSSSKVAQAKLVEYFAAENPELFICTIQPGVIPTDMLVKASLNSGQLPMDTGRSCFDFTADESS